MFKTFNKSHNTRTLFALFSVNVIYDVFKITHDNTVASFLVHDYYSCCSSAWLFINLLTVDNCKGKLGVNYCRKWKGLKIYKHLIYGGLIVRHTLLGIPDGNSCQIVHYTCR